MTDNQVRKNISLDESTAEVVEEEDLNLSAFVRNQIRLEFPEYFVDLEDQ